MKKIINSALFKKVLSMLGKDEFHIDDHISGKYLIMLFLRYFSMFFKGFFVSLFNNNIGKNVLIGKRVKMLEKNRIRIGDRTKIYDNVYIDGLSRSGVVIGKEVVLGRNTRIECTGSIQKIGDGLKIGDGSSFGYDCFFGCSGGVTIGENVLAGQLVRFHSENHIFSDPSKLIKKQGVENKGIVIGNNNWIGAGSVFLDGSSLGNGCVVAANSVVTKKFGDNLVIAGVPAKIIKNR